MSSTSVYQFAPSIARPRVGAWRHLRGGLKGSEYSWAIAFLVPYIGVFVGFVVYPAVYGLWMGSEPSLYSDLLADPIYQRAVVNTVLYHWRRG